MLISRSKNNTFQKSFLCQFNVILLSLQVKILRDWNDLRVAGQPESVVTEKYFSNVLCLKFEQE